MRSVLGGVFAFSPNQVSSTQAFYDPSDLTSLYQSRNGGSIVSADGQTVGIMLDKSQMGGQTAAAFIASAADIAPTLVPNGTVGYQSESAGKYSLYRDGSGSGSYRITLEAYKWYRIRFYAYPDGPEAGHNIYLNVVSAGVLDYLEITFPEGYRELILYTGSDNRVDFSCTGPGVSWSFSGVTSQELPGHHAIAPSDAARPLYKTAGGLHWLQPDGTDDFKQVSPTLDLGETWWHVGGWKATSGRAFTTTSWYQNAIRATGSRWIWYNDAGAQTSVSTSDPVSANVTTIEKASNASLSLRFNGVGEVSAINPFDETGVAGLALFTQGNGSYAGGLNGRFYGGTFGTGTLSPSDRAKLEAYTAAKTGVTL